MPHVHTSPTVWAVVLAIGVLLAAVGFLAGPVRRQWRRLVKSLATGLAAGIIVVAWADKAEHAALTAHGASVGRTLVTVFGFVTIVVTAALITIGTRRAKKLEQLQRDDEISRPVYPGSRYARRYQNGEG